MKRIILIILSLFAVSAIAYIIGVEAAQYIRSKKESSFKSQRAKDTKLIIKKMNTVRIGDSLPNYFFYDLDGTLHELQKIIDTTTLLVFFSYDCSACLQELELLSKMKQDSIAIPQVILISYSNPFELIQLENQIDPSFQILYDHGRAYNAILRVASTPFNFLIDGKMVINEILPGQIQNTDLIDRNL